MKKYLHVFENEIVYRYQESESIVFGGPWQNGQPVEVPENMDLETVQIEINDGEITVVEG